MFTIIQNLMNYIKPGISNKVQKKSNQIDAAKSMYQMKISCDIHNLNFYVKMVKKSYVTT